MNRTLAIVFLATAILGSALNVQAAYHRRAAVGAAFPIHRTLPFVSVRRSPAVIVEPRTYFPLVPFGAVVVNAIPTGYGEIWQGSQRLARSEGWTDFSLNVGRRGDRLYLNIDRGAAQISFVEVVFNDGQSQVIDFNDQTQHPGLYSLVDFTDGRKVDHVRVVAKADTKNSEITLRLTS
jgi:hypothetical protein